MLLSDFKTVSFEQSPRAYRNGMVEIKAHKNFNNGFLTYSIEKGYMGSLEIVDFIWAFRDFFKCRRDVNDYCNGETFLRSDRIVRSYGVVIEGKKFKYNVRITNDTCENGVNYYIVITPKASVAAA